MKPITPQETVAPQVSLKAKKCTDGLIFVFAIWILSRLVIVVSMQLIAPLMNAPPENRNFIPPLPLDFVPNFVPKLGWELFSHWDGAWYRRIATLGYDYADDGKWHSVAFFPLFPLLARGLMTLGLPFEAAGTLVNNLAFLGALLLLYRWAEERYDIGAARWATAVLAWCPLSLYGTVVYTEGLFLLLTTAALRSFDNRQHVWAALWGAMATATRATGAALVPAFLFVAWRERRPAIAYATSLASVTGLLLFSVYCAIRFGDPLAFVHVQKSWGQPNWWMIFAQALTLNNLNKSILLQLVMVFGGSYLLWRLRAKLPLVAVAYGFCSVAILVSSGALSSIHRYAYGIVSLSLALGVFLESHPRWGYPLMGLFAVWLVRYAIKFSWWIWVA